MSEDDLIAASDANYFEQRRLLAGSAGILHEDDGILITAPSHSLAWLNVVFVTRPLRVPGAQLAKAFTWLNEREIPFMVHLREGLDEASERAAERLGLQRGNPVPGMALVPIPSGGGSNTPLEIRQVQDNTTFSDFVDVIAASFGIDQPEARGMMPARLPVMPNTYGWVGYADGRAVASSCLLVIGGAAGVNMIGTLEQYRGRGFGEAMTWHAVKAGAAAGCRFAVLQASEMGKPVYERMGFRVVCEYKTFVRPEGT